MPVSRRGFRGMKFRVRRGYRGAAAAWFCVALVACDRAPELDAPPPDVVSDADEPALVVPPSIVESEVRYDLAPALAALEAAIPRTFGDIDTRIPVRSNRRMQVAFAATRAPVHLRRRFAARDGVERDRV